jgi:protein TonB
LLRFRHYPPDAERRGFTGVTMMRFSVDRSGRIVSSILSRSSGHDVLDQEAEAWLARAQPLPPPPPDMAAPFQILLPLNFVLH